LILAVVATVIAAVLAPFTTIIASILTPLTAIVAIIASVLAALLAILAVIAVLGLGRQRRGRGGQRQGDDGGLGQAVHPYVSMVWAPEGSFGRPVEQELRVGPGA